MMKANIASLIVAMLMVTLGLSPALAQAPHAKWTIMIYVAANNNLEPNSITNLMEMAAVGSTDEVNIVVQLTRPPNYSGFYGEWGGTRRFRITKSDGTLSAGDFQISPKRFTDYINLIATDDGYTPEEVQKITRGTPADREAAALSISIPTIDTNTPLQPLQLTAIEDMGDQVDSGDGATLADFGTWAAETYPADHYGLVLWDHGGGWSMIASDDTQSRHGISMPNLQKALTTITGATGQKFDFIGFDACLMSQLAVTTVVAPFADYQIGAEELVPGLGWDYTAPLAALVANPQLSVPDFAKLQIDAFYTLYTTTEKQAAQSFDMGVTDLSKISDVVTALEAFEAAVKAAPDELGPISTARSNVQSFGSVGESQDVTEAVSSVDLIDFMRLLSSLTKDDGIKDAARAVITSVRSMVLYHKASKSLPRATGLSVYFPQNNAVFSGDEGERYRQEFGDYLSSWQGFLDATYASATASAEASKTVLKIDSVSTSAAAPGSIHDTPVVSYTLDGKNIVELTASIIYKLSDAQSVVLDQFPVTSSVTTEDGTEVNDFPEGESSSDFYWNTRIPDLSDGKQDLLVLMTTNSKDEAHGFVRGVFTSRRTGEASDASLLINLDSYESSGVWAESGTDANAPVAQLFPKPGDTFEPTYIMVDTEGQTTTEPSGTRLVFGKGPLKMVDAPGPDGQYAVSLEAADASGASVMDTTIVEVSNDGLDASLQGFKDLGFGLNFLYPQDWTDVDVTERDDDLDELSVSDINGDIALSALDFTDTTSLAEVEAKLEGEVNAIDGVTVGDTGEQEVGGQPGTTLSYSYTDGDGVETTGIGVAVFVPETSQGYVLLMEAPTADADEAAAVLDGVAQTATFFQPAE